MTRPVIGISAYSENARWGLWDQAATLLPANYAAQVADAGGAPVLLPPVPGIEAAVGQLDGLILSGGPDIEPARYGQEPGPATTITRPERDAAEIAMFRAALAAGLPVLGICRGMQVMNVALGGTLIQHVPDVVGHDDHSPTPGAMAEHKVTVAAASGLARWLAAPADRALTDTPLSMAVPTHHHQGVDQLGTGLVATAWAEDGLVEAVELDAPFAVGVQWHPEAGTDPALFLALVSAAEQRRS